LESTIFYIYDKDNLITQGRHSFFSLPSPLVNQSQPVGERDLDTDRDSGRQRQRDRDRETERVRAQDDRE